MHAVLSWDGPPLPALLAGLTDRPPGAIGPDEMWWPSVGCGPVEPWWALWWTVPDRAAARPGMVRSDVALWRLDQIGEISDLRPTLALLSGCEIVAPEPGQLAAVATALLADSAKLPVVADLEHWPGILAGIWQRLWPAARRGFAARVALNPPQGGESMIPPWLFATPAERAPQWWEHTVVRIGAADSASSRGVSWLCGGEDRALAEVVVAAPALANRSEVRRAVRAAERLDTMRSNPGADVAIGFLRTLTSLARQPELAAALKKEAVALIERDLPAGNFARMYSLANLDEATLPAHILPTATVRAWIERHGCTLNDDEAAKLVTALAPQRASTWWAAAVAAGLQVGLTCRDQRWAEAALHWLGRTDRAVIWPLIQDAAELALVDAGARVTLSPAELQVVRGAARDRGWSVLHAWAAMHGLPPASAFQEQLQIQPDPMPGLALLAERLPGDAVVAQAISGVAPSLIEMAVPRTLRDPGLMAPLDPAQPGWCALWTAHVAAGGPAWPPAVDHTRLGRATLDACLRRSELARVIESIAADIAEQALDHPERARLWQVLPEAACVALLRPTADALLNRLDRGAKLERPEPRLERALLERLSRRTSSSAAMAEILAAGVDVDENTVVRCIVAVRSLPTALGEQVAARGWRLAATQLYQRRRDDPSFYAAAAACQDLLSRWQRWNLAPHRSDHTAVVERVAEFGAELIGAGLEDLWNRAGGRRGVLTNHGSLAQQWHAATLAAYQGSLEGGLARLVSEMQRAFPHNSDLRELAEDLAGRN